MSENALSIVVTGDLCPYGPLEDALLAGKGSQLIKPVLPLFEAADLVVANLETPLCSADSPIAKCGPHFRVTPRVAPALKRLGIDTFALCNNHIMDQGVDGLRETLETLDHTGIPHCGAGLTHEDASRPAVFSIHGREIAVFNFGEGEFAQAQRDGPGAARLDPFWSAQRVRDARDEFEIIVVLLHVGNEYMPIPSPVTTGFCRQMAAAGADAVIAHHAHIPQCTDEYRGVPICYCTGNFLFGPEEEDYERVVETMTGWYAVTVVELTFCKDRAQVALHPFRQQPNLELAPLPSAARAACDAYLAETTAAVADPEIHRRLWEQEARNLFHGFRTRLPGIAAALNAEDPAVVRRAAAGLYNTFRCDAHHAACQTGLQLLHEGHLDDDPHAVKCLARFRELMRQWILA